MKRCRVCPADPIPQSVLSPTTRRRDTVPMLESALEAFFVFQFLKEVSTSTVESGGPDLPSN